MITAQFITTDYVYRYTIIEANVDADMVNKFIWKAQYQNIQEILGTNLYNKLVADCPNFTNQYLTLMNNFVQPVLAEWVVFHMLPFINFRLTNKAVSIKSSDNSQPSTVDDIKWLQSQVRNNAEFLSQQMMDYIKNNIALFPEFYQRLNPFDMSPNKTNYFSGIATKGRLVRAPIPPLNNIDPNDFCC
jgi:hypothetical protein